MFNNYRAHIYKEGANNDTNDDQGHGVHLELLKNIRCWTLLLNKYRLLGGWLGRPGVIFIFLRRVAF